MNVMHRPARPREARARVASARLSSSSDPLDHYAALTDGGRRPDTMLFERTAGPTLLMDQAAVRVALRGRRAELDALTADGREVLRLVAADLASFVVEHEPDRVGLSFPAPEGDDPEARMLAASPFDALRSLLVGVTQGDEPFASTLLGTVAFDAVDMFETLPANAEDPFGYPDALFWLASSLLVFEDGEAPRIVCTGWSDDPAGTLDRLRERCRDVAALPVAARPASEAHDVEVDLDDVGFAAVVGALRERIMAGDIYQVVPSRTFRMPCGDPLAAYAGQRALDRSPYCFFVSAPDHILFGASPETSVRIFDEGGTRTVEVKPIAGTAARGATPDEDDRYEAELRLDAKETAEHMMLVDLARNDVARVSEPGTRRIAGLMRVERYARLMHLVSSVQGTLRAGLDALHALQACLNVGTLTGAPKIRATELLRETEKTKRGPYGGAVGWLNGAGYMDTGVVIRSAVVVDGTALVRAGAGVVYDSDPMREAAETRRKASALLSVLAGEGA